MDYDKDCKTCGTLPKFLSLSLGEFAMRTASAPPAFDALTRVDVTHYPYAEPHGRYYQCPECDAWFISRIIKSGHFYLADDHYIWRTPAPDSDEAREYWEELEARREHARELNAKFAIEKKLSKENEAAEERKIAQEQSTPEPRKAAKKRKKA